MPDQSQMRAVIFDLGGVLLRTEDPQPRTQLAQRYGKTRTEMEQIVFGNSLSQLAEIGQANSTQVWEYVAQQLNTPVAEIGNIEQAFFGGDQVDFELIRYLQKLRAKYTTALLSNTWRTDLPDYVCNQLQIKDTFDFIISSASMGTAKPEADIFQKTLSILQVSPEEAVFVDDNADNIAGAAALGLHTILFKSRPQTIQLLQGLFETL